MFAPRFRAVLRPLPRTTSRCLRQQRIPLPRNFHSQQMRRARGDGYKSQKPGFWRNSRLLFNEYPYSMSLAIILIGAGVASLFYVNYFYVTYIVGAFHKFPEEVAKPLRKALWYTNYDLNPQLATKHYKEAIRIAHEIGFDPFSDEMMGVRIQVASLMEKIQQYQKAIDVLEIIKSDNLGWIDLLGSKPGNEAKRTRVLAKTIAVSVKLSELYSNDYIMNQELAEERLVWAVETALKEMKRRDELGLKRGDEGEWLSEEEMGATLETLGHMYEERDQHYLAAPLFLQALTLAPPASCHTAILMNNLSISLAQQLPPPNYPQPVSREATLDAAQAWAEKAVKLASQIKPPERNEECDMGCAVATHNLGELAEMGGNYKDAKRRFEEAKSLAKAIGFEQGVKNAVEALKRIAAVEDSGKT